MPRLTKDQWEEIRAKREGTGVSFKKLADEYGVSDAAIVKRSKSEGWSDGSDENAIANKLAMRECLKKQIAETVNRRREYQKQLQETRAAIKKELVSEYKESGDKPGFIYVMEARNGKDKYHKIGRASNVKDRRAVVQSGCPFPVEVIASAKVSKVHAAERAVHEMFKKSRTIGEWFKFHDDEIESVREFVLCLV